MNNNLYTSIAIVLVGAIAVGAYFYPSFSANQTASGSATGSTFTNAKAAAVVFAPADATATTTFMYNSDANDRYVTGINAACTGVGTSFTQISGAGLAALQFRAATSSTNTAVVIANTNNAAVVPVATSTPIMQVASSTIPTNAYMQVWGAGTYMAITSNATNTAVCTVSLPYLPS